MHDISRNCLSGDQVVLRELRASAAVNLRALAVNQSNPVVTRIINCVISLVRALPVNLVGNTSDKHNLLCRYLRPILDPLFDNFVVNDDVNHIHVSCDGSVRHGGRTIGFLVIESYETVMIKNRTMYELGVLGSSALNDNDSNFLLSIMAEDTHLRFFLHQRTIKSMTLMIE